MDDKLQRSKEIYQQAVAQFQPYAVVLMMSGGNDSMTAAAVSRALAIPVDFVLHGITGTGIHETLAYVRQQGPAFGARYIEADAGDTYEKYVLRKGFFGQGRVAHSYTYHLLKRQQFRSAISRHIRQRKRNRTVLLLNGARLDESDNRRHNLSEVYNVDPDTSSTVWVNLIHHWSGSDCKEFLADQKVTPNPVTQKLCRSGECLCGTFQNQATRTEASYYYPEWGQWLDGLEKKVHEAGFTWGWGENMPREYRQIKAGQLPLPDFQPACNRCLISAEG
jgi:3'-phosphoadenosine 5'-phosphosulfate sulfotransferase (PAPS reductase)/FAD synthetase